jgi:cytochrome c oxidase subunit 2
MGETAASALAREVDSALLVLLVSSIVVLLGITAVMIYFIIRFHRSKTKVTRQITGNLKLEVAWTIIPTIMVIGLFFVGYKGFALMRSPPSKALEVMVTGQRWFWSFYYPAYDISASELVLPLNKAARLNITAKVDDVIHSLFIPAFRVKEDAVPGMTTFIWVMPDRPGRYNIFCAEFCGTDHSKMLSTVRVVSEREFEEWRIKQIKEKFRPVDFKVVLAEEPKELKGYDGKELFTRYCQACHGADGKGGGPYKARNFTVLKDWKRSPKLSDIFRTMTIGLEKTEMRSFSHLPVKERLALTRRVASFETSDNRPGTTDEDIAKLTKDFPELDPANFKGAPPSGPVIPVEKAMEKVVQEYGEEK